MKVEEGKMVTLEYTITSEKGELIESSVGRGGPLTFLFGAHSGLPEGINEELRNLGENDEKDFSLPPDKAFGTTDSGPTMKLPKNAFPEGTNIKVGASFQGDLPGTTQTINFVVIENLANEVVVRLIHPLAGKTINVKTKVLGVRDATPEELKNNQ